MPAREIQIVSMVEGRWDTVTPKGLQAIQDADLIAHDDTISGNHRRRWPKQARTLANATPEELTEAMSQGLRVTRIISDSPRSLDRLEQELRRLRLAGYRSRIFPHREIFKREAWTLQLPWLVSMRPSRFRLLESTGIKGERGVWEELALTRDTLAVEVTPESVQPFVDRLLMLGADPGRPVALVAHHPLQDPICWLTTLSELDEIYPQWKTDGATILYIGSWPERTSVHRSQDFWGPLAPAADHWLRTGTLAETY